jgi:hypothetical protein
MVLFTVPLAATVEPCTAATAPLARAVAAALTWAGEVSCASAVVPA